MATASSPERADRAVRAWLWVVWGMILTMVVVGGITRLTGSGLSMVEWRPLMGALPPLSEAEWLAVFEQYKQSPQYQQVNHWMTLGDFERIFFWEYFHRLLGRLIGVVVLVPGLWFLVRRRLRGKRAVQVLLAFVFGGLQGLLGWYMVKSGLVDVPAVSHYRLAAHLSLAFFVGCWILWILMGLRAPAVRTPAPRVARGRWSSCRCWRCRSSGAPSWPARGPASSTAPGPT
ncbi:MAG: COX15/CtaA family protein [bacterium]